MGKVITFCNNKGGTGKTRTALTFSSILAENGYKVLLLDFDGQKNATTSVLGQTLAKETKDSKTLMTWLRGQCGFNEVVIKNTENWLFDIVPGSASMSIFGKMFTKLNEFVVAEAMEKDEVKSQYDFIVIDTAPAIDDLLASVLMATDEILFVSTPYRESPDGIARVYELVRLLKGSKRYNPNLKIDGILITMIQTHYKSARECADQIRLQMGKSIRVYDSMIRYSTKAATESYVSKSLNLLDPHGITAQDYKKFVAEWAKIHSVKLEATEGCEENAEQIPGQQLLEGV